MFQQSQHTAQETSRAYGPMESLVAQSALAIDEGFASTPQRILDFIDDLDAAMRFMTRWPLGSALGLQTGQGLERWGITLALSERAERDAEFRREYLGNPRYVSALAIDEGLGIKPIYYLWQVKRVDLLEEAPGLHWLVLPACHRGCEALDVQGGAASTGSCRACGKPLGPGACQRDISPAQAPASRIHDVDEFIARSVQADASSRARLLADPRAVFAQAAQELHGVDPLEEFGIREVRVAEDTDTTLYFVLLARHQLLCAATGDFPSPGTYLPAVAR